MALSDLTNPDDPYRKSLEGALYNRQADVINTSADKAQNAGRENAFSRGVGFSSILPDYTTAPIERERARALSSAAQNAFLGAGQEARANSAATNQPLQFAQSQSQQAGQFAQQQKLLRQQLSQQANQNLMASLVGGSAGLASLLLRPSGTNGTVGGNLLGSIGSGVGSAYDRLFAPGTPTSPIGDIWSGGGGGIGAGDIPDFVLQGGDLLNSGAGDLSSLGTGAAADTASQIDPETLAQIASIFGF